MANQLICLHAAQGRLGEARRALTMCAAPNAHTWTSIILAHARLGVALYRRMRLDGAEPDDHVLTACAGARDLAAKSTPTSCPCCRHGSRRRSSSSRVWWSATAW